jgi:hypothetical protein
MSFESNIAKLNRSLLNTCIHEETPVASFVTHAMVLVPASPNHRVRSVSRPSPSNPLTINENGRVTRHGMSCLLVLDLADQSCASSKLPRLVAAGGQSPPQIAPS